MILHLYRRRRRGLRPRLNGQWAFAIWDAGQRTAVPVARPPRRPAAVLHRPRCSALSSPPRSRRSSRIREFAGSSTSRPRSDLHVLGAAAAAHDVQGRYRSCRPGTRCRSTDTVDRLHRVLASDLRLATVWHDAKRCADELLESADRRHTHPAARRRAGRRLPERRARLDADHGARQAELVPRPPADVLRHASTTRSSTRAAISTRRVRFLEHRAPAIRCSARDIAAVFPDVIWHAEKPMLRTAPAPLFLLSRLVRDRATRSC